MAHIFCRDKFGCFAPHAQHVVQATLSIDRSMPHLPASELYFLAVLLLCSALFVDAASQISRSYVELRERLGMSENFLERSLKY